MFAPFGPTGHYRYRGFVCAGTTDSPTERDRQKNLIGHYIRYFGAAARAGTKRSDNGSSPLGICSPSLKVGASPSPSRSLPCFSPCVCVRSVLCLRSIFLRAEGNARRLVGREGIGSPAAAPPLRRSLSEFVLRPGRRSIQFQMVREREPNARRENEVMPTNYPREDLSAYFVSGEKTTPRPREGARKGEAPLTFPPYLCMVRTSWTSQQDCTGK